MGGSDLGGYVRNSRARSVFGGLEEEDATCVSPISYFNIDMLEYEAAALFEPTVYR